MRDKTSAIVGTFTNLLVVVTMITTITAILTILPYSSVHWRTTWIACGVIFVLGLIAVIHEARRLYRLDMARLSISRLLAEGTKLNLSLGTGKTSQAEELAAEWCGRVEVVLRQYLDESYVTRFHLGGSLAQNPESLSVWKNWHRLETLESFLQELK